MKLRQVEYMLAAAAPSGFPEADRPEVAFLGRSNVGKSSLLVESYLEQRETLRRAVLLQDVRRDASEDETLLLAWLAERGVESVVALTKCDKLKPMRRAARIKELVSQLPLPRERIVATSSQKGFGIDELWQLIDGHVA